MWIHENLRTEEIKSLIKSGLLNLGGNKKLKIYGLLSCRSGKRMKKENRVFFKSESEALKMGFRPCGHCMRLQHQLYKSKNQVD